MTVRFIFRCFAIAAVLLSAQVASAQTQTPADVLSQSQMRNGGKGMEDAVLALMSADKNNLSAIINFAKTANEDQRKAIGRALADVAKAYASGGDPADANTVQQAVVTSGLPELAKAYADAGGDTGTASIGGGGAGPTAGGPPTGGPNGGVIAADTFASNQGSRLTDSSLGGGGFSQVSPF